MNEIIDKSQEHISELKNRKSKMDLLIKELNNKKKEANSLNLLLNKKKNKLKHEEIDLQKKIENFNKIILKMKDEISIENINEYQDEFIEDATIHTEKDLQSSDNSSCVNKSNINDNKKLGLSIEKINSQVILYKKII